MNHIVLPTASDGASRAAAMVAEEIESSSGLLLGLAGGSTPQATYANLADMSLDWSGVTTWMTDERWVPPMDPDSNQSMIRESLRTPGRIRFLAPNTRLNTPEASADRMERSLRCVSNGPHSRAVTLLGMGDDGHTASPFPGTDALSVDDRSYVANWVPQHDTWRLTASYRGLAMSNVVVFLVAGGAKAAAVARIAQGEDLPAGRVEAGERVIWLLDEPAASGL